MAISISLPAVVEKKQFRIKDEIRHWTGDAISAASLDVRQFEDHTIRRSASVNVADLRTIRVDLAAIRTAHRLAGILLGLRDPGGSSPSPFRWNGQIPTAIC